MQDPLGMVSGVSPGETYLDITSLGYKHLYTSFWLRLSANWTPPSSGINKIGFVWMHGNPILFFSYAGAAFPLLARVGIQNSCAGSYNLTSAATVISDSAWHHWEVNLGGNTPGVADGEVALWFDGTQVVNSTTNNFACATQGNTWQTLTYQPTWGGTSTFNVPASQDMFMDNYYASGAP